MPRAISLQNRRLIALAPVVMLAALVPLARAGAVSSLTVCASGCQYTSIADALSAATDGDQIAIGAGTFAGGFTISKDVTLTGAGAQETTINGGGSVVTIATGASVMISGVGITGGTGTLGSLNPVAGGISNHGTLRLLKSAVYGNTAGTDFFGGGGAGIVNDGLLTVVKSEISGNRVLGRVNSAGGIANGGTATLIESVVSDNGAGGYGGGIQNGGVLTIADGSVVVGNRAGRGGGGGIANEQGTLTISGSLVAGNSISLGNGGGIYNEGGNVTLINSEVFTNSAGGFASVGHGGGIASGPFLYDGKVLSVGSLLVIRSVIAANQGSGGGAGIAAYYSPATLIASAVTGNTPDNCFGNVVC